MVRSHFTITSKVLCSFQFVKVLGDFTMNGIEYTTALQLEILSSRVSHCGKLQPRTVTVLLKF